MGVVGFQGPFSSWEWTGINYENQIASDLITMPESGVIQRVGVYVGGRGGAISGYVCVWDASGNLIRQVAVTFPAGSDATGGQSWTEVAIDPITAQAGFQYRVGWWRDPSGSAVWSYGGSGSHWHLTATSGPTSFGGTQDSGGRIGAYLVYTAGSGVKRWDGSRWVKHPVKRWDGTAWRWHPVKRWDGSKWVTH